MDNRTYKQILIRFGTPSLITGGFYVGHTATAAIDDFKRRIIEGDAEVMTSSEGVVCHDLSIRGCTLPQPVARVRRLLLSSNGHLSGVFSFIGRHQKFAEKAYRDGKCCFVVNFEDTGNDAIPGKILSIEFVEAEAVAKGNLVCYVSPVPRVYIYGVEVPLSYAEASIFHTIFEADHTVDRYKIEDRLYDTGTAPSKNVLEVLISRIRKKLKHAGANLTIRSVRSMGYELGTIKPTRAISKIVLHSTSTNFDISMAELSDYHTSKCFDSVGFHFLVRYDGSIERGRPLDRPSAEVFGHGTDSIDIAYSGASTRHTHTEQQTATLKELLSELARHFPGAHSVVCLSSRLIENITPRDCR